MVAASSQADMFWDWINSDLPCWNRVAPLVYRNYPSDFANFSSASTAMPSSGLLPMPTGRQCVGDFGIFHGVFSFVGLPSKTRQTGITYNIPPTRTYLPVMNFWRRFRTSAA
jgi:hypothetical protein